MNSHARAYTVCSAIHEWRKLLSGKLMNFQPNDFGGPSALYSNIFTSGLQLVLLKGELWAGHGESHGARLRQADWP